MSSSYNDKLDPDLLSACRSDTDTDHHLAVAGVATNVLGSVRVQDAESIRSVKSLGLVYEGVNPSGVVMR